MKKYLILNAILIFIFLTSTAFSQQATEISAEKKAVIAEIIKVTKAEEQMKDTLEKILGQMDAMYPAIVDSLVESDKSLSPVEREKLKSEMINRNAEISKKFNRKFIAAINYSEFLDQVFYPLYDKFFTVEELNDLLAFYKSPTGQKFNSVMPEFSGESIKLTQTYLLPKIDGLMKELMEDLKNNGKENPPPPPPPAKRGK
jgi:hypothetical protein